MTTCRDGMIMEHDHRTSPALMLRIWLRKGPVQNLAQSSFTIIAWRRPRIMIDVRQTGRARRWTSVFPDCAAETVAIRCGPPGNAKHVRGHRLRRDIDARADEPQWSEIVGREIGGEDRFRCSSGDEDRRAEHVCGVRRPDDGELVGVERDRCDRHRDDQDEPRGAARSHRARGGNRHAPALRATNTSSPGYVDPYSLRS